MSSIPYPSLSQELRYLLPVLYIIWADDVLSPTEITEVTLLIQKQQWLSEEDKSWLLARLTPAEPPSAMEVKSWLSMIRQQANQLATPEKHQLIQLSRRLAGLSSQASDAPMQALAELEKILSDYHQPEEVFKDAFQHPAAKDTPAADDPEDENHSFSIEALRRLLEGDSAEIKNKVFQLLSDPVFSYSRIPEDSHGYRELVFEWTQHLADQGMGGLSYPTTVGGAGNMREYISVFETLGHHDISLLVKFGVQFGLFGGAILNLGTEYHHQTYLAHTGSLALPGCFAMTEANHGSNVRELETTATYHPETESFILQTPHSEAFKEYIGNAAAHARMAVVFAQLYSLGECFGVHAFLVPIRDDTHKAMPGVKIGDSGHKLGLNGVDNGRLWFNQVRIPRTNLLDRFGQISAQGEYTSSITSESARFFTMLGTLVGGRICVPMGGLSATKSGLTIAIRYAHRRRQFGKAGEAEVPIISYPSHQQRLMPLLAKTYVLDIVQKRLADRYDQERASGEISRELENLAAGIKSISTWHTTKALQECREACGGNGFLSSNRIGQLKSDTDIFTTFEGDNTVLLQLVAKGRMTEFQRSFGSAGVGGMIGWAGQQAWRVVSEKNPVTIRNTDPQHLLDHTFHLEALRYHEERLVWTAGLRLKQRIKDGMAPYDAFIDIQLHLLAVADAYIHRYILEDFHEWLSQLPESAETILLRKIGTYFALNRISETATWYLEQGYMEGVKTKAISSLLSTLSSEMSDLSLDLTEAWRIPDFLLVAPIARKEDS